MIDADKKEFKLMMKIVCSNYSHAEFDNDTLRYWFGKLEKNDLITVSKSFDNWIDSSKFMPTVKDILDSLKPVTPIYNAISRKADKEANRQHAKEVVDFVNQHLQPKNDYKAWAKKIINNPGNYPDISLKYAREALGIK